MKKTILFLAPLLVVMGLHANSKKNNPQKTIFEGTTLGHYSKPGAPIDMSYKTKKVDINESADVNITLNTTAQNGKLMVSMNLDDNLILLNNVDKNQSFEIQPDTKTFSMNLKVSSKKEGLFYIRLLTKVQNAYASKLRSFAVPVYVGNYLKSKTRSNLTVSKVRSGENISVSKAVEHIKIIKEN